MKTVILARVYVGAFAKHWKEYSVGVPECHRVAAYTAQLCAIRM